MRGREWLVVYDISDDDKRNRVARILRTVGFHIQMSTFYITDMTVEEINKLASELAKYLNKQKDRLFIYPVEELEFSDGYLIKPWEEFVF